MLNEHFVPREPDEEPTLIIYTCEVTQPVDMKVGESGEVITRAQLTGSDKCPTFLQVDLGGCTEGVELL
jgi:hypothetical protein